MSTTIEYIINSDQKYIETHIQSENIFYKFNEKIQFSSSIINLFQVYKNNTHHMELYLLIYNGISNE